MKLSHSWLAGLTAAAVAAGAMAFADNIAAAYDDDGKYFTDEDVPTFNITEDRTIDWYTFSGYRRYHSECHVCHGPDGMGSSYAPALVESIKTVPYYDFLGVVAAGRQTAGTGTQSVMPAFGVNNNVMCYVDDIYVYLRARAFGELPRGRPAKREDKSEAYSRDEDACMG
jgi:methanol metabolism-related c-type cytochrome